MRYDWVSDIFLLFIILIVVGFVLAYKRSKKQGGEHVMVPEESYNVDRQQQELKSLKNGAKKTGVKLGSCCLSFILLFIFLGTLGSIFISFLLEM